MVSLVVRKHPTKSLKIPVLIRYYRELYFLRYWGLLSSRVKKRINQLDNELFFFFLAQLDSVPACILIVPEIGS